MPKTLQSQPPSPVKQPANAPAPDKLDKMSEITLRKKKNADAQAAFRARRANYIATLEETVSVNRSNQLRGSCSPASGLVSQGLH
ncbi:uncharacterized protein FOMMEDRAFT_149845 [Fomitiporia mediterranea MF3/22]|uniref:uncharacterized protein n=1 Tax=Fomitiporia mediterranea (strain MF3/22) TaxID=694068 RepID=UPI00044085A1|nr:uncharacterized protein FOMMEDRAFT_149845 [Fomitiporia mediterranea MF3/22]EJD07327.1 hypothetical protein FOMMEDRAFT_149845 [Fomitiporia mediterranea MF3/22]